MFDPEDPTPQLESLEVGAVPVVAHFLKLLDFEAILDRHLPPKRLGRRSEVPHGKVLSVMVTKGALNNKLPNLVLIEKSISDHVVRHGGCKRDRMDSTQVFGDSRGLGRASAETLGCCGS